MAGRFSSKDFDFSINSIAIEDELDTVTLNVDIDMQETTAAADAAKTFVEGKYGWGNSVAGKADLAAAQGDATLFALLGAGSKTVVWTPGGGAEGADNPDYTGQVLLSSYRLTTSVDAPATYTAEFIGTGALERDVQA